MVVNQQPPEEDQHGNNCQIEDSLADNFAFSFFICQNSASTHQMLLG